jgi:hypothetical protein
LLFPLAAEQPDHTFDLDILLGCRADCSNTTAASHEFFDHTRISEVLDDEVPLSKRAFAKFIGTFWLVFGGCGSAVLAAGFPGLGIGFVGVAPPPNRTPCRPEFAPEP